MPFESLSVAARHWTKAGHSNQQFLAVCHTFREDLCCTYLGSKKSKVDKSRELLLDSTTQSRHFS